MGFGALISHSQQKVQQGSQKFFVTNEKATLTEKASVTAAEPSTTVVQKEEWSMKDNMIKVKILACFLFSIHNISFASYRQSCGVLSGTVSRLCYCTKHDT